MADDMNDRAGQQGEARPARAEVERLESIIHDALWTGRTKPSSAQVALDQLAALATQAAPEAQAEPAGEPVAWGAQEDPKCRYDGKDACIDCLMQGDCMARPAASGERDTLRALLREARDEVKWWVDEHSCCSGVEALALVARIDAALADGRAK